MFPYLRRNKKDSLWIIAALWPLALLAPFIPGLPRASVSGLTWRQETVTGLLLCLTFGAMLVRGSYGEAFRAHASRPETLLRAALALFVGWSTLSLVWAINSFAAVHYALSWGAYMLFLLLVVRALPRRRLLYASLSTLAIVALIINCVQIIGHLGATNSLARQNGLGEPMAVLLPLFTVLALHLRRRRAALLCGATALTGWLSILQISERAPFIGTSVGLLLVASLSIALPRFRPRDAKRAGFLAAAFAVVFALQAMPSPFAQTIHSPIYERLNEISSNDLNTQARLLYWAAALEMTSGQPLAGVGAGNFSDATAQARTSYAATHPASPLIEINENFLCAGAHNEYLQILAELGVTGFALFLTMCVALMWAAARALRHGRSPLAVGAFASLAAFAISSGASSLSFRWMGSGLVFFFVAALALRLARGAKEGAPQAHERSALATRPLAFVRRATLVNFACALLITGVMCAQAANVLLLASAQMSAKRERAETLYRAALAVNPYDPATHFNFGTWLHFQKRGAEAVPHLAYAVERGFSTSTCYAYLAGAQENAGELAAAERTLARAVGVYPRSVFLRVRHAAALARAGQREASDAELARALSLDARTARGWQELIEHDIDAAIIAARADKSIAMPGELYPDDAIFAVLAENEQRFPESSRTGWRARMRRAVIE